MKGSGGVETLAGGADALIPNGGVGIFDGGVEALGASAAADGWTVGLGTGTGFSATFTPAPSVSEPQSASRSSVATGGFDATFALGLGATFELWPDVSAPQSASISSVGGGGSESGDTLDRLTFETGGFDAGLILDGLRS